MENPPSTTSDEFHNFLCYDDVPGILIPQKVHLDYTLPEPKHPHHFATFYRHENSGVTLCAGPGATLGVSLADALAFSPQAVKQVPRRRDPALAPLEGMGIYFVFDWPGCFSYSSDCTRGGREALWTAARLAKEVAQAVHKFYGLFATQADPQRPAPDWTPNRIPFDKLYLLELRQVAKREFQPVFFYDAD